MYFHILYDFSIWPVSVLEAELQNALQRGNSISTGWAETFLFAQYHSPHSWLFLLFSFQHYLYLRTA